VTDKIEILLIGPPKPTIVNGLEPFTVHRLGETKDQNALLGTIAPKVRAIAASVTSEKIDGPLMGRLPHLEIVATFGVGYDHIDVQWAAAHGVTVTNTPQVLTEEVADTGLGLLLCAVREFPQAERYLRAGKWVERAYPLTKATLRNRTVGMVGMGAIGQAIARRLDAMRVPVVYHSRRQAAGVTYRYYPNLLDMARVKGSDQHELDERREDAAEREPEQRAQEPAPESGVDAVEDMHRRPPRPVAADGDERAVREVEDAHQPVDEREAGRDEEVHRAETEPRHGQQEEGAHSRSRRRPSWRLRSLMSSVEPTLIRAPPR